MTETTQGNGDAGQTLAPVSLLDRAEWKIEHRDDGISFVAFPYNLRGKTEYGWAIGPMDRHVAEWIYDAVKRKQSNVPDQRPGELSTNYQNVSK